MMMNKCNLTSHLVRRLQKNNNQKQCKSCHSQCNDMLSDKRAERPSTKFGLQFTAQNVCSDGVASDAQTDSGKLLQKDTSATRKILLPIQGLKVHGHGQTHSCNLCRFKSDI